MAQPKPRRLVDEITAEIAQLMQLNRFTTLRNNLWTTLLDDRLSRLAHINRMLESLDGAENGLVQYWAAIFSPLSVLNLFFSELGQKSAEYFGFQWPFFPDQQLFCHHARDPPDVILVGHDVCSVSPEPK